MKNLKISSVLSRDLDLQSEVETLLCSAFDVERNRVFFASSLTLSMVSNSLSLKKEGQGAKLFYLHELSPITLEPGDCIAAMDYLMEKEALIIGTSNGCLVLHIVDLKITEVVGSVEGGVMIISSSPDGALLAVTAGLGHLLVMTHDWEILYETALDSQMSNNDIIGDVDGSSCTQFRASISWRGDGKYFATLGGLHDSSSLQKLRIWERESGMLHFASESKTFVGASLAWMPSGAKLVSSYYRKDEKKCALIVFFE